MKFKAHASGSSGNFYVLECGQSGLAIEAGLPFAKIQRALNFKASELDGVLITHAHKDHSRAAADLAKAGVYAYASAETLATLWPAGHHRENGLVSGCPTVIAPRDAPFEPFAMGSACWQVVPFDCKHDVPTLGFLIGAPDGDQILFATDTAFVPITAADCTHFAVECNYSMPLLEASSVPAEAKARIIKNHMGLERVLELIEANDTSRLREIHLLHLSDGHSDADGFKLAVERAAPKVEVFVAPRGA